MCWMDFHNATLCCGFLCARLISFYSVSILLLFCVSSSLFPATTPRATTPHLYRTGYHAFTTTARLPRLSLSRLPRHSSLFYSWVITPELSRSTTHVHRVITPAIVVCSLPFTGYYANCSSPPTPPPGRHTCQPTPQAGSGR